MKSGHKEDGILVELVETSTMQIRGRVYAEPNKFMADNNQSYLWFEYFGTGQYAEMGHIGNTTHFKESGYTEWLIPVKPSLKLNYRIVVIEGVQFYLAHGVKSNHFLEDAEFKTRQENKEIVAKKISEMLKEVAK